LIDDSRPPSAAIAIAIGIELVAIGRRDSVIRDVFRRFQDTKAKAGKRQAQSGRGMTGARWNDSRDDFCDQTAGVMVRCLFGIKTGDANETALVTARADSRQSNGVSAAASSADTLNSFCYANQRA
jgi:hypothetical protein